MTEEQKYSLKYKFEIDQKRRGFTKEELKAEGAGGCDALVFVSIVREGDDPHEGSKSIALISRDGFADDKNTAIPNTELFQVMVHIAHHLSDAILPMWQRRLALELLEGARRHVVGPTA